MRDERAGTVPPDPIAGSGDGTDAEVVTRVDHVYRQLREALVDGEYAPGTPLRPDRLSRIYKVSLIPIREALRKLEVERLVEATPNKGVRVAPISVDDLVDVYATREMLEVEALQRAWPAIDAHAITQLRGLCEAMIAANHGSEPQPAYELHRRVHFAIYELSRSPWLLHLIDILWNHTERYRRTVARVATFLDEGQDLHGRVVDWVAAGQLERASEALRMDLRRTRDLILAASTGDLGADATAFLLRGSPGSADRIGSTPLPSGSAGAR